MLKQRLRDFFLQEIPESDLEIWFDPLSFQPDKNNSVQVRFPHRLFFEWFNTNYRECFERGLKNSGTPGSTPVYCDVAGSPLTGRVPKPKETSGPETLIDVGAGPLKKTGRGGPVLSFDNFLFNRKNEFPVSAARKFARLEGAGQLTFYAAPGYGKTHLLSAIFQELKTFVPENNIFFGMLDNLETIVKNSHDQGNSFFPPFYGLRALVIDNFQECGGKAEFQKSLVKLLELCSERKIYIAMAMDASPAACAGLSGKLRSRLESGLIIEIKKPDLDVKTRYIQSENERLGLKLKKEEVLYLARLYSEFRQINGTLLKILSFKSLQTGDMDFVLSDILKNSGVNGPVGLTPDTVLNCVAGFTGITAEDIRGKGREKSVVFARHLTMYILREVLSVNLSLIGEFMGRDHSSVIYSVNNIKEMMKANKDINKLVTNVKNLCLTKNIRPDSVA